jgi:hypothetical protein
MKSGIIFAALFSLFGTSAFASSWNYLLTISNDDMEYFFDAESVNKTKEVVNLWAKTVQTDKAQDDGSWSVAYNWKLNCAKRTIQLMGWSTYDSTGKFIKSYSTPNTENPVIPDSVGESVLKVACMADFPKNTPSTKNSYFAVANNDIFAFTKRLIEFRKSQIDNAPK